MTTNEKTPQEIPAQLPMQIHTINREAPEAPLVQPLPSASQIGDQVILRFRGATIIDAFVRAITFTSCKVRYSVFLFHEGTTLHNIDSAFVEDIKGPKGWIDFGADNYS